MNFIGIIPARYASTRFPGKPLAMIDGKTMIRRVYEQALKSSALSKVVVATDDERIKKHVEEFGGNVVMTSAEIKTGTDRCYDAVKLLKRADKNFNFKIVINIQGDEPFINPGQIDILASCFNNPETEIATLIKPVKNYEELINPNVVKVVTDSSKKALYFSRSVIPYARGKEPGDWLKGDIYYKHIGIYAFRINILENVTNLEQTPLEMTESLEQLRWLENGFSIQTEISGFESYAVDSPEDLLTINEHLKNL